MDHRNGDRHPFTVALSLERHRVLVWELDRFHLVVKRSQLDTAQIARTMPTMKSLSHKLKVVKDVRDVIAHKQDDIITRYVKERIVSLRSR